MATPQQWQDVLQGAESIAHDPEETEERRELALSWLDRLLNGERLRALGSTRLSNSPEGRVTHRRSGGMSLMQDAIYDGWGDHE